MSDDLRILTDAVRNALAEGPSLTLHTYDCIDSTNREAKRQAPAEVAPALYLARAQTEGRGRLGRSFYSPDTGLYMTVAYTTDRPLSVSVRATALAAVAATAAIEALTDKRPRIKWVNDLYMGNAKVAGILTEAVSLPGGNTRMLIGIGINVTTAAFPDRLRAPATALFSGDEAHRGTPHFTGVLAGQLARSLLPLVTGTPHEEVLPNGERCLDFYRRHLLHEGERVLCTRGDTCFEGILRGVNEDYALLVETDRGLSVLDSGEISVRVAE